MKKNSSASKIGVLIIVLAIPVTVFILIAIWVAYLSIDSFGEMELGEYRSDDPYILFNVRMFEEGTDDYYYEGKMQLGDEIVDVKVYVNYFKEYISICLPDGEQLLFGRGIGIGNGRFLVYFQKRSPSVPYDDGFVILSKVTYEFPDYYSGTAKYDNIINWEKLPETLPLQ